jgi:hypothetical protein
MMNQSAQIKSKLCFSRWSRKSYALFSCLGKEVTIGVLKYKLADSCVQIRKKQEDINISQTRELKIEREEEIPLLPDITMELLCPYGFGEVSSFSVKIM